jgi:hypothetical protein
MLTLLITLLASPAPIFPPDDPDFDRCLRPKAAIELRWDKPEDGLASWLVVKRRDDETGEWRPWVKRYVQRSPFALTMRSRRARNGEFAWILFGVDRAGGSYAAGEWHYFCTRE